MMRTLSTAWLFIVLILSLSPVDASGATSPAGKNVVLWISVDGFRGDYVDRGQSPFLSSLVAHGLYTRQLTPVFPSLTFPNHISEVTGVRPGVHGIISNRYLDTSTGKIFNLSIDPGALRAEPIWLTATRQGVRTAVIDWPLSEAQDRLPPDIQRTAYYTPDFNTKLTDVERLEVLVDKYRTDSAREQPGGPLRLLMGYVYATDKAGHKAGPDAAATTEAIRDIDKALEQAVHEVADVFQQHAHPEAGDALYVLITTDHGMSEVKTVVNLRYLMGGSEVPESVIGEASGSVANVYLHQVPASQRDKVGEQILAKLRAAPFAKVWKRAELPKEWQYDAPNRTGDIVVSLDQGYDFSSKEEVTITPIEQEPKNPKGMHGYDPAEDKEMLGFTVLSRVGSQEPGRDLGPVDNLRIHPTVAKLLGIEPAPGATAAAIEMVP